MEIGILVVLALAYFVVTSKNDQGETILDAFSQEFESVTGTAANQEASQLANEIGGPLFQLGFIATAKVESPRMSWVGWNPADGDYGVSVGIIQFNQVSGTLDVLLKRGQQEAPAEFAAIFGEYASNLTDSAKVKSLKTDFNHPALKAAMIKWLQTPTIKRLQIKMAYEIYWVARVINPIAKIGERSDGFKAYAYNLAVSTPIRQHEKMYAETQTLEQLHAAAIANRPAYEGRYNSVLASIRKAGLN